MTIPTSNSIVLRPSVLSCLAIVLLTCGLVVTLSPAVQAQPAAAERSPEQASEAAQKEAASRYQAGVKAYAAQRYLDAIDLFLQADQLAPSPALSYNIARAYDKILDTAGALKYYRDYLRRAPEAEDHTVVGALVVEREQALAAKGLQQLTVMSEPSGATVVVGGRPLGVTPWTGELAPGYHTVALQLRGYADAEQRLHLEATSAGDLIVRLTPAPQKDLPAALGAQAAGQSAPQTSPVANQPTTEAQLPAVRLDSAADGNWGLWPWISLSASVATLGASGVLELMRRRSEQDAKAATVQVEFERHYDTMESRESMARVLAGVGGGLVLVSGLLFVLDSATDGPSSESSSFSASCGVFGCQAVAGGTF